MNLSITEAIVSAAIDYIKNKPILIGAAGFSSKDDYFRLCYHNADKTYKNLNKDTNFATGSEAEDGEY